MAERRSLTAGLVVVPPGTDPDEVQAFVKQEAKSTKSAAPDEPDGVSEQPADATPKKPRRARKGPLPVGLIPVTVRLKPELAGALKRASLERQLAGEEIHTQQDLVELALEPWLRDNGFL